MLLKLGPRAGETPEIRAAFFEAWRDYRNLFGARPDNTLLVKASYWFGR